MRLWCGEFCRTDLPGYHIRSQAGVGRPQMTAPVNGHSGQHTLFGFFFRGGRRRFLLKALNLIPQLGSPLVRFFSDGYL